MRIRRNPLIKGKQETAGENILSESSAQKEQDRRSRGVSKSSQTYHAFYDQRRIKERTNPVFEPSSKEDEIAKALDEEVESEGSSSGSSHGSHSNDDLNSIGLRSVKVIGTKLHQHENMDNRVIARPNVPKRASNGAHDVSNAKLGCPILLIGRGIRRQAGPIPSKTRSISKWSIHWCKLS